MHISSGAIIYKIETDKSYKILLLYREFTDSYHLSKGTQNPGETLEKTAKREILEETGCEVELDKELIVLNSQFQKNGEVVDKETHYFLARSIKQTEVHDKEHDAILWLPADEVIKLLKENGAHIKLGYENEIEAIEKFQNTIR